MRTALSLCVAVSVLTVAWGCLSDTECGADECCATNSGMDGKRGAFSGRCLKKGIQDQACYMAPWTLEGVYVEKCPCASGHFCQSTGVREVPLGELGKCTRSVTRSSGASCSSGTDCDQSECCINNNRPIGKRLLSGGHCAKMGSAGSSCLVRMGSGKPDNMALGSCPCSSGFMCKGTGLFDIPLGEMGTCS